MILRRSPHWRETIIGLDWACEWGAGEAQSADVAQFLIRFADQLRQGAVEAQQREALSTTQIRLLLLLKKHRSGLSATMAARHLDRTVPVILNASGILLQRQLIIKARMEKGARSVLQISAAGLETVDRLEHWRTWLDTQIAMFSAETKTCLFDAMKSMLEN